MDLGASSRFVPAVDQESGAAYSYAKTKEEFRSMPFKLVHRIAKTSNGLILLMKSTTETPQRRMAAKSFLIGHMDSTKNEKKRKLFMKETAIMQTLNHKNIVHFGFSVMGPKRAMIFMDFCPEGSLYTDNLQDYQVMKYFVSIVKAVGYLHQRRIIHRDIKLDNILIKNGDVLLTDFGLAKHLDQGCDSVSGFVGTEDYMAPEVYCCTRSSVYDGFKADSYSMGVYLYCLLLGVEPERDENLFRLWNILESSTDFDLMDPTLKDFARQLLAEDPNERLSMTSLHASLCQIGYCDAEAIEMEEGSLGLPVEESQTENEPMEIMYEGWETLGAEVDIE